MTSRRFSFVVAVNDTNVLRSNLLLSPALSSGSQHQLITKRDFSSAAAAYNSGIQEATNDIVIFVHQDIYLHQSWCDELNSSLDFVESRQAEWGVLGCFGSRRNAHGGLGRVYTTGMGWHGRRLTEPEPVETLDEIVLIIRRSSALRFDSSLPHFHLYGTDICMSAIERALGVYAFQGSCVHNTNQLLTLPKEFYTCYRYVRSKWRHHLPIHTSCMRVSVLQQEVYRRKIKDFLTVRKEGAKRVEDPRALAHSLDWLATG